MVVVIIDYLPILGTEPCKKSRLDEFKRRGFYYTYIRGQELVVHFDRLVEGLLLTVLPQTEDEPADPRQELDDERHVLR